ncbi:MULTISPECIES: carboxypeptidase-like regulatory domain-containing protein [unclassified Cupriavidus]|uniref:carboxypeptidase-like regulatory domain-containing protein n=1 Tax=unclassified Cupriavidus TaxID=2640874 RepID=UPI0004217205|nr:MULTISPECIES: carboxypeptidase-like regulatory domain-containing protein [unclassified Cupriavidus]MBP0630761.1 carboxypeptidase regulatory-like domain-containing protein [Cupriavidus sp. AcVe19-1a]MBP0637423.1 carboxypeptidase regulatory-like domain-containing protein [Cupriavidus sp. AcVe19-6a]
MKILRRLALGLSSLAISAATIGCATRAAPADVQIMEQHGVSYVSGGEEEAGMRRMLAIAARFNVRLTMVDAGRGNPLSGATVVVASQGGHAVLHTTASGPLFYMQLKPGAYRLAVGYQGRDQMRDIVVAGEPLDMTFRLPVNTLEDDWLLCGASPCARR